MSQQLFRDLPRDGMRIALVLTVERDAYVFKV
jgi:hypothetical protein